MSQQEYIQCLLQTIAEKDSMIAELKAKVPVVAVSKKGKIKNLLPISDEERIKRIDYINYVANLPIFRSLKGNATKKAARYHAICEADGKIDSNATIEHFK